MESTRETSTDISDDDCLPPTLLTPNSKIKALLATLDEPNDESTAVSARDKLLAQFVRSPHLKSNNTSSTTASLINIDASGGDTSDEEDFIRPAGKRAQRPKKFENLLHLSKDNGDKSTEAENKTSHSVDQFDISDEDITPFTSRRKKTQKPTTHAKFSPSSSLFVSPHKQQTQSNNTLSDSESLPEDFGEHSHIYASLRKKKMKERQIIDAKALRDREKDSLVPEEDQELPTQWESNRNDENVDHYVVPQPRTIQKASKKALEEINRETQRISRNQQLAHKAMTKKKFTKSSLFAKFNFRSKEESEPVRPLSSGSATPSTEIKIDDTPPTSPILAQLIEPNTPQHHQSVEIRENLKSQYLGEESKTLAENNIPNRTLHPSISENAVNFSLDSQQIVEKFKKSSSAHDKLVISQTEIPIQRNEILVDESDSDLEIVEKIPTQKKWLDDVFDRIPAKKSREPTALHALKMLAHLSSPSTKKDLTKSSISNAELQITLQQRARNQAMQEREERLALLKARGITIQTNEEMEKEQSELDDMLSKAREEAERLAKLEKCKTKGNSQDAINMVDETSDDEDYTETGEEIYDDVSLSGSEEENDSKIGLDDDQQEDEKRLDKNECEDSTVKPLLSDQICDSQYQDKGIDSPAIPTTAEASDIDEEILKIVPSFQRRQKLKKKLNVISDDEDDSCQESQTPSFSKINSQHLQSQSSPTPCTVLRSATKPFIPGISVSGPAGLGLTQIFNGTMDESQPLSNVPLLEQEKNSPSKFSQRLSPTFGSRMPTMDCEIDDNEKINQSIISCIPDSQTTNLIPGNTNQCISDSDIKFSEDLIQDNQVLETQGQTQDIGFVELTPIEGRFIDGHASDSETFVKRKKLRRKRRPSSSATEHHKNISTLYSSDNQKENAQGDPLPKMHKSTTIKKKGDSNFDKKQSAARELVNEQAEESEDEYAGLGGPSDDEAGSGEDEYMNDMIDDDESGKTLNESELAAFYADRERANDEKQIEKLYNDITKGMLRRRRGTDYDLSDSDDGGEALRRRKRKEFTKMRKALLADERISKIATNPKTQAFLRAIEDRCSEDENDFFHDGEELEGTTTSSQFSQSIEAQSPTPVTSPSKRKFTDMSGAQERSASYTHRAKNIRKMTNLSEIRESPSSLTQDPQEFAASNFSSDSDDDLEIIGSNAVFGPEKSKCNKNLDPFAPRNSSIHVIDRMSLKRASSSHIASGNSRLAFASSTSGTGLIVPPLLRRAMTNSSIASGSSTSSSINAVISSTEREAGPVIGGVKRGGTRGSGVNYFARESERRAKVEKSQKRREQKLFTGAMDRRIAVDGLLGSGKFE